MTRIFLDSSVLFSAAYSIHGYAHDLILMAIREELTVVTSQLVLAETRRNLSESAPEKLIAFERVVANVPWGFVRPTKREVRAATKVVALKDAPIVAAARKARVHFLVTFDEKHLLGRPNISKYVRSAVVTPKVAMAHLAHKN
jgi:predicted nucleic acid-binding protein